MPPKKVKELAEAPVYRMSHDEQVQLLSDALLREYMHRRGFRATLKAFDEEHPRDDNTISSRAVMSDLMALQADDQQRMKGEGVETIMEMLCNLRVERRMEAERLSAEAQEPLPKVPAKYDDLAAKLAKRAARTEKKPKHKKAKKTLSVSTDELPDNTSGGRKKKSSARSRLTDTRSAATARTAAADMTIEDLLGSSHSSRESVEGDSEDDTTRRTSTQAGPAAQKTRNQPPAAAAATTAERQSSSSSKPAKAPAQPAWMELKKSAGKGKKAEESESASESSDSDSDGNNDEDGAAAGELGGEVLSAELQDELGAAFQLLCGFDGGLPHAFLEQGFAFDEDLECALVQWRQGGCDAVVAPIQAFVAAYFYEREVYVAKEQRQQDCLVRALCAVLEQAQPNASKVVLVDGAWRLKKGATRLTRSELRQQAETPRARCWTQLTSMSEVKEVLRGTLLNEHRWMDSRGSGLLSFVLSLLLSRGVDVVRKELSAAAPSGERLALLSSSTDGSASFALANLVLSGRAVSHRHNGMQNGNQMGYPARLKCGMLIGDTAGTDAATTLPASAYTNAQEPVLPSWVVRHKNHYANLYMTKDTRQIFQQKLNLGGSATEELVYWDAATEDDAYTLSVTVRGITLGSGGGGGARNAKSFVNTAITSVPVWSSAEVNWNGDAPLRD